MAGNTVLEIHHLSKTFGTNVVLRDIDFSVAEGDVTCIIGASGSGKSTLLHLLGGVDRPTEGEIRIEDTDISTLDEEALAAFRRRKVGLIYQFYNLIPTLTIKKNILLPVLLDGRRPDLKRFDQIVTTLGLTDRLEHLPGELSGGQQQRAAIARSLISRPAILLADEPTGNLDRKNSQETLDLLKLSHRRFGQTVLLITHDEKLALEADRILTMEDGRVIKDQVNQS